MKIKYVYIVTSNIYVFSRYISKHQIFLIFTNGINGVNQCILITLGNGLNVRWKKQISYKQRKNEKVMHNN